MISEAELTDRQIDDYLKEHVRTAIPAVITSVNPEEFKGQQQVSIRVMIARTYTDNVALEPDVIDNVPVTELGLVKDDSEFLHYLLLFSLINNQAS